MSARRPRSDLECLVEIVDEADTSGAGRDDLTIRLGLPLDRVLILARQAVDDRRVYAIDRRLYSTRPFDA